MQAAQTASGLIIPRSALAEPSKEVLVCSTCVMEFPMQQQGDWERHIVKCAARNEDLVEAELAAKEETYLTSSADPEHFAWVRNGGT